LDQKRGSNRRLDTEALHRTTLHRTGAMRVMNSKRMRWAAYAACMRKDEKFVKNFIQKK
jgi:hypothetical protein